MTFVLDTPWGTLPVLYWDDEEIGQAFPIARFVARKAGLAGKDDIEMARADVMADQVADLIISRGQSNQQKAGEDTDDYCLSPRVHRDPILCRSPKEEGAGGRVQRCGLSPVSPHC